jgi:hypothetical protein
MYQFSRAIYRDIAQHLDAGPAADGGPQTAVLAACEAAMHRLALDRKHFRRPARALFAEIRGYFPLPAQPHVWAVVEREVAAALAFLDEHPEARRALDGAPETCGATNRKGRECNRTPVAGTGFCPSHQSWAEEPGTLAA